MSLGKENGMKRNWKTTLFGVISIIGTVAHVIDSIMNGKPVDPSVVVAGVSAGAVGIAARDHDNP